MKPGKKKKVDQADPAIPEIDIVIETVEKKKKTLKGKSTKKKAAALHHETPHYWNGTDPLGMTVGFTTSGWYYLKKWLQVAGPFVTETKAKNAQRKQSLSE